MIQSIKKRFSRINPKQLVVAAGFTVAMFGAVSLGLVTKQLTSAASVRDTDRGNSIMNDGTIGCLTLSECVSDIKANKPGDLQAIYTNRGLRANEIDRFAQTAKAGTVYKDGRIVVDGQIVATNAWSMGRETWGTQRQPLDISGKRYYMSPTTASFASNSIDAFVMFDAQGAVEFAILTACGNPVWGDKVTPEYSCKMLNQRTVAGQLNTYEFNTTIGTLKNASVSKVVYNFGDGTPEVTTHNPDEFVRHTFAKSAEVTVTVHYNVPGGTVVAAPVVSSCKKKITFVAPFYSCDIVLPRELNTEKTKFRFTVKASAGNGATLKDADFTLDGGSSVTGVATKDADGNIYKEYEFARDGKEHTVVVKVNFNLASGVQSKECQAKVTSGKTPMCTVPGKEHLPVDSPECKQPENCPLPGKTHLPKNSPDCGEVLPATLPEAGMGGVAGLFVGTSILGTVAHRLFMSRRQR